MLCFFLHGQQLKIGFVIKLIKIEYWIVLNKHFFVSVNIIFLEKNTLINNQFSSLGVSLNRIIIVLKNFKLVVFLAMISKAGCHHSISTNCMVLDKLLNFYFKYFFGNSLLNFKCCRLLNETKMIYLCFFLINKVYHQLISKLQKLFISLKYKLMLSC